MHPQIYNNNAAYRNNRTVETKRVLHNKSER